MRRTPARLAFPGAAVLVLVLAACGPRFNASQVRTVQQALPTVVSTVPGADPTGSANPEISPSPGRTQTITTTVIPGKNKVTGGVVKVGGLFPRSGGLSSLGEPAFQGADAYFRWVNDRGGVRGKKFDFLVCDDRANDTQSSTCGKKLVEQDKVFVMGPSFTPFSATVIRQMEQAGVPWIGHDGINVEAYDATNVVTIGSPVKQMAHALLPYWMEKSGGTKIGVVVLNVAPAQAYVVEAKNVICPKLGCSIVGEKQVEYTTTNYGPICSDLLSRGAQAIWVVTDPSSAAKLFAGCRGYSPPKGYLGQHGIYLDLTLEQSGSAANGMMANSALLPDTVESPATAEMKRIIRTYYPEAKFGYFTSLAYASARVVVDLVEKVLAEGKDLDRANILAAAAATNSYDCRGLCKGVNLKPPARSTGGNHNIWIVKATQGRWVYESGPIDAFGARAWPCPGKPC